MKIKDIPVNIYGLVDPRNGNVFYVGATRYNPQVRLKDHVCGVKSKLAKHSEDSVTHKRCAFILGIIEAGLAPSVILLETTTIGNAGEREEAHVKKFVSEGLNIIQAVDRKFDYSYSQYERERSNRHLKRYMAKYRKEIRQRQLINCSPL